MSGRANLSVMTCKLQKEGSLKHRSFHLLRLRTCGVRRSRSVASAGVAFVCGCTLASVLVILFGKYTKLRPHLP